MSARRPPSRFRPVELYETDAAGRPLSKLGRLYDDGSHGDVTPADTLYSGQFVVNDTSPRVHYYRTTAAYKNIRTRVQSPVFAVSTFAPLPETGVNEASQLLTSLQTSYQQLLSSLGVTAARARILADALANPAIGPGNASLQGRTLSLLYKYTDPQTNLSFEIPLILFLDDPSSVVDGAGRSVPPSIPVDAKYPGNDKVLVWGPGYNVPGDAQNGIVTHAVSLFNGAEYMSFTPTPVSITARGNASLEQVKTWGNYGTIVMHTHGGLWNIGATPQVVLLSGTPNSQSATYSLDIQAKRVALSGGNNMVFFPSFVTKYVGGMKNTFIYLGACESLQNDTMWNALKGKGAKVAFGWSETVNRAFNEQTFSALLDPMLPQASGTGPLSAAEAFANVPNKVDAAGGHNATLTMRTSSAEWGKFTFVEGGIVNGDFETGDWSGWTHGAALSDGRNYQIVAGAQKHGGAWSGALGRWDSAFTGEDPTAEPAGAEWFYQDFVVPSNATKLSFWWFMETYDTAVWDWFDAQVQDTSGRTLINLVDHGGKPGSDYGPYWTPGSWQKVQADVTALRGKTVRIRIQQVLDGFGDQTRTYFDDFKVE